MATSFRPPKAKASANSGKNKSSKANAHQASKATKAKSHAINGIWFKEQIERSGLTHRQFAEKLGVLPSTVSQILSGKRRLSSIDEVNQWALLLRVSFTDVASNTGSLPEGVSVDSGATAIVPKGLQAGVPIKGFVDSSLAVTWGAPKGPRTAPPINGHPSESLGALRCQTAGGAFPSFDGSLVYYREAPVGKIDFEALGRICLVQFGGKSYLREVTRGYREGRHNLLLIGGQPAEEDVLLERATLVLHMTL